MGNELFDAKTGEELLAFLSADAWTSSFAVWLASRDRGPRSGSDVRRVLDALAAAGLVMRRERVSDKRVEYRLAPAIAAKETSA